MQKFKLHSSAVLAAILLLCAVSCQQKKENKIVVIKTLVCDSYSFGLVGNGSCLFDYKRSVKGYLVQLKTGDDIVRSYYCLPEDLNFHIEKMRYEYMQNDSTIMLPSK